MEKKVDKFALGGHFHFITKGVQKNIRCKLLIYIYIYIIDLNVNKLSLIQFDNILKIYIKYVKNVPLIHNI